MKRCLSIKVVFVALLWALPTAAQFKNTEWTRSLAKIEAISNFEQAREWTFHDGDLQSELEKCTSSNSAFDPVTPVPAKDSPIVKKLCELLPTQESLGEVTNYAESCEFTKYTPCAFEFEKKINFQFTVEADDTFIYGFNYTQFTINQHYPAFEETFIVVHCALIAVLGLEPRWVCGGGFDTAWLVLDFEVTSAQDNEWFLPLNHNGHDYGSKLVYSGVNHPIFLKKVLGVSGVLMR